MNLLRFSRKGTVGQQDTSVHQVSHIDYHLYNILAINLGNILCFDKVLI